MFEVSPPSEVCTESFFREISPILPSSISSLANQDEMLELSGRLGVKILGQVKGETSTHFVGGEKTNKNL